MNYEIPNLLDAAIGSCMHFVRFGEPIFKQDSDSHPYTRCQEIAQGYDLIVAGFLSPYGLDINNDHGIDVGVAALLKFF